MSSSKVTIPVGPTSDGTGATPASASYYKDDQYYLDAIALAWMKDQNRYQPGISYTLSHLPAGYAGFAKPRDNSKHVDRYLYGHPNGIFRSIPELYPHFKNLQENGGPIGCICKLCTGRKPASKHSGSPVSTPRSAATRVVKPKKQRSEHPNQSADHENRPRQKQVDDEGCEDVFRKLLDQLKEAGPDWFKQDFIDQASPDWRTGHELVADLLSNTQRSPRYEPRLGELVIFDRSASPSEGMAWDPASQALRKFDLTSHVWLELPKWEAGVVTQIPVESLSDDDLNQISRTKKQAVTYSGYRVEALTPLSTKEKPIASQHKYAPLHAIRPFAFWKDCVQDPSQAHPTISYAMKVANSFCIIGKQRFEGQWPAATLFAQGVYIGPELILVGDAVRLLPSDNQSQITDVMIISSIRLRFVNLEEANDDDYDDDHSYHVCLHVQGKAFSLDPKKSWQGRPPVQPGKEGLPHDLAKYGQWYSMLDPANPRSRLEVPFSRVMGKCFENVAMSAWWAPLQDIDRGQKLDSSKAKPLDLSRGLLAMQEARQISAQSDHRIDKTNGKTWFWAETRIEQLDLHEINDRFVGMRDEERKKAQMHTWRQALRILDGKRSGFDAYHEARKQRAEQEQQAVETRTAFGLMGGTARNDSGEDVDMEGLQLDGENEEDGQNGEQEIGVTPFEDEKNGAEVMEVSDDDSNVQEMAPPRAVPRVVIDVSSDEDEIMRS